jgi:hypothetical protein
MPQSHVTNYGGAPFDRRVDGWRLLPLFQKLVPDPKLSRPLSSRGYLFIEVVVEGGVCVGAQPDLGRSIFLRYITKKVVGSVGVRKRAMIPRAVSVDILSCDVVVSKQRIATSPVDVWRGTDDA